MIIEKLEPGSIITSCLISYQNTLDTNSDSGLIEKALKNGDLKILPVIRETIIVTVFDISNHFSVYFSKLLLTQSLLVENFKFFYFQFMFTNY